jgi:23S rRNA pseudouridine2604 synthase
MTEPERLAKRIAAMVPCSRREAEMYIEGGWVRVDGAVVEQPQFKVADQRIEIDPAAKLTPPEPASMVLFKPAGMPAADARSLIRTENHFADDASGVRMLHRHFARLELALSLPDMASGFVVFSQDWRVKRRLHEDIERIEQELVVEVAGTLSPENLALLSHGLVLDHYALPPIKVSWQSEARLRFAMKRVSPETVLRMCEAVGLDVLGMKRIRVGRIPMGRLEPGQWRYLPVTDRF